MLLTKSGFNRSEECASEILARYRVHAAPIPLEEIVMRIGLDIVKYDLGDDISGILIINEAKGTIGVNPKDGYYRQRFSIAHELGHFLLHKTASGFFVDKDFLIKFRHINKNYSTNERKQEQEANAFAAALLMPAKIIESEMDSDALLGLTETELIAALAYKFRVSEVAMSYRFTNLNNYF